MIITNELIQSYKPCQDGIDEFNVKYPAYDDTLTNLLSLDDIPYDNKIWLVGKVVDIKILQQWAVECVETVVDNYNKVYPNDNRVNECIEINKLYLQGKCSLDELYNAQSAVGSAVESAVGSARSAVESAAYYATRSARSAVDSAELEQETINLSILIALLENK